MSEENNVFYDDPNRIHRYNELSFYPRFALDYINNLENNGFVKTEKDDKSFDDFTGLITIHNLFDYFRISAYGKDKHGKQKYLIESYELQKMKLYNNYVVVKEHKHKILDKVLNRWRCNKHGNLIYFRHFIINFADDKILQVTKGVNNFGEEFQFNGVIAGFETESKTGRLYNYSIIG